MPEVATTNSPAVAAMIPVAIVTLDDTLLDNPAFRANIKLFEGQVLLIETWLITLLKSVRLFTEEWQRLNEVTATLHRSAEVPLLSQGMLRSQYTLPAMKLVGAAFKRTLALKHQYISEVNQKVLTPLDEFLKTDLKDFKEAKKVFEKALEKYESTLAKYNGQNRQKEASAIREEAFQLYDTRKAYILASMNYSMLCIKFQDALDQLVLGVFLDLMATQHDYFSGNSDQFASMALQVLQLKTYVRDHKEASALALVELEQNKERYIADAIEYWRPSRSLKCYTSTVPVTASKPTIAHMALSPSIYTAPLGTSLNPSPVARHATIDVISSTTSTTVGITPSSSSNSLDVTASSSNSNSQSGTPLSRSGINSPLPPLSLDLTGRASTALGLSPPPPALSLTNPGGTGKFVVDQFTPTTKQGYLSIRIPQPKNRAPVWQRKYFFIQQGEFGFESVVPNSTIGAQVVQSERIAVLLCEVRYGNTTASLTGVVNSLGSGSMSSAPSTASQGLAMVQMERRFCFEVVCATQSYLLQAETEDDLMSWVATFEAAKREILQKPSSNINNDSDSPYSPLPEANTSFTFPTDGELTVAQKEKTESIESGAGGAGSEQSAILGSLRWAASVPGVSKLLDTYKNSGGRSRSGSVSEATPPPVFTPPEMTHSPEVINDRGPVSLPNMVTRTKDDEDRIKAVRESLETSTLGSQKAAGQPAISVTETNATTLAAGPPASQPSLTLDAGQLARTNSASPSLQGGRTQPARLETLLSSALHPRPATSGVSEIPEYPIELVVRNRELHVHFEGAKVHAKECVIHSWTSGYRDDTRTPAVMVYGRIYLTQSGMYFYTRELSIETKRMYRFSTIRGIECEQMDISTEWRIETIDGEQHVFSQFTLTDVEYQVLHLIWTNAQSEPDQRMPVRDLFRKAQAITHKRHGAAGTGSLAESEGTQSYNRDGKLSNSPRADRPVGGSSPTGASSSFQKQLPHHPDDDSEGVVSASEEDLTTRYPADMTLPSQPVACRCDGHLEKVELEKDINVSAKVLNKLLFEDDTSPIWKEYHARRHNEIQSVSPWVASTGSQKTRTVKFLMVVNNPLVKLNQTDCVESQTCEIEEEYLRYVYTVKTNVLAMPYSDAFTPVVRYCITYVSQDVCKLTCSSGIEWIKNPLVKAMIRGAVNKGTAETVKDLSECIQVYLERTRAASSQGMIGPPLPTPAGTTQSRQASGRPSLTPSKSSFSSTGSGNQGSGHVHVVHHHHHGHGNERPHTHHVHSSSSIGPTDRRSLGAHIRNSSGVRISLQGPESDRERMLSGTDGEHTDRHNSDRGQEATRMRNSRSMGHLSNSNGRTLNQSGAVVANGTSNGGMALGGSANSGTVQRHSHWPHGAQPTVVSTGSRASRTKMLGRPKSKMLQEERERQNGASGADTLSKTNQKSVLARWLGSVRQYLKQDGKERLVMCCLLAFSFMVNVWAGWNSQRLLKSVILMRYGPQSGHVSPIPLHMDKIRGHSADMEIVSNGSMEDEGNENYQQQSSNHFHQHNHFYFQPQEHVRVAARSVLLKDLEEIILQEGTLFNEGKILLEDDEGGNDQFSFAQADEGLYGSTSTGGSMRTVGGIEVDPVSFNIFLEVRDSFRPERRPRSSHQFNTKKVQDEGEGKEQGTMTQTSIAATAQPTKQPAMTESSMPFARYPWVLNKHRRLAAKLVFQKDRVGILRYDLLYTFEVLKQLERQILESEYVNWLMDERLRCRRRTLATTTAGSAKSRSSAKDGDVQDKENSAAVDDDADEDSDTPKLAQVTAEFCQSLERQVQLFAAL